MTRKGTLRIKICGLQRLADVEAVNRCRPDWAGFVFAPGRRRICPEEARVLRAALRKDIPVFGVFVNAPVEEAAAWPGRESSTASSCMATKMRPMWTSCGTVRPSRCGRPAASVRERRTRGNGRRQQSA